MSKFDDEEFDDEESKTIQQLVDGVITVRDVLKNSEWHFSYREHSDLLPWSQTTLSILIRAENIDIGSPRDIADDYEKVKEHVKAYGMSTSSRESLFRLGLDFDR